MTKRELLKKLKGIESQNLEFKLSKNELPKNIWETVSGFANTMGGYIVLGVEKHGEQYKIEGINNSEKLQSDFLTTLRGEKFNIPLAYYKVDYLEIPGTEWGGGEKDRRWTYRILCERNLFEAYFMILPRLRIRAPNPFQLDENYQRNNALDEFTAIREAFVNLLIHADYFSRKRSNIHVYDNRIEMYNGGYLLFDVKNVRKGYISEPRNPYIMRAFRGIGLSEDVGSGFARIFARWKNAAEKEPEFESDRRNNHFIIKFIFDEARTGMKPEKVGDTPVSANGAAKGMIKDTEKDKERLGIKLGKGYENN